MRLFIYPRRIRSVFSEIGGFGIGSAIVSLVLAGALAIAQNPAPQVQTPPAQPAATQPPAPAQTAAPDAAETKTSAVDTKGTGAKPMVDTNPTVRAGAFTIQTTGGEIKEDQLKQMLVGKTLYLRAGYQDNNLEFDEQGRLTSHSPQGSFTLSQIQINKVNLSKHKLELQGDRYALHFLGAAPYEDPTKATDRVKITPKKKTLRVFLDREQVETPKKKKEKNKDKQTDDRRESAKVAGKNVPAGPLTVSPSASSEPSAETANETAHFDSKKETTTTSPAHASQLLLTALDKVFSQGIDDRMIASMPDFWKLYYQAAQAKADIKPVGSGIYSESNVDEKAKLISVLDPPSNEFAQSNGVAGIAMYHALVGSDGKVEAVVAGRPIGFGLDESAQRSILKATFQPAIKGGKPVPVALDLVVSFRIYSKRTSAPAAPAEAAEEKPSQAALPGPYTLQAEEQAHTTQQTDSAQSPQPAQSSEPAQASPPAGSTEPAQGPQTAPRRAQPTPSPQ